MRSESANKSGRAFTLPAVIAALVIVLVGLLVWKVSIQYGLIPAGLPMASKANGKALTSAMTVGLGSLAIAGGIGAACYFMSRRSSTAALLGMAITMILPVGAIGFQLYSYATRGPGQTTSATAQQTPAPVQAPAGDFAKGLEAMKELARRSDTPRPSAPSQVNPGAGLGPEPVVTPPAPAAPATPAPSPAMSTCPTPSPRIESPDDPNVQKQLDELKASTDSQIADAVDTLGPVLNIIAKSPRSDLADLRKRLKLIQEAKDLLSPLAVRLRGMNDEAKAVAERGGAANSLQAGIRFANAYGATTRAFAGDKLVRLLDHAASESQLLLDNSGRWKVDREGRIESKDFKLQSSANSDRFFVNAGLKTKDEAIRQLRGE